MPVPPDGLPRDELLQLLDAARADDVAWNDGRTWGLMYFAGEDVHDIAREAFGRFLNTNALDPSAYPSTLKLEREVVAMAIDHLRGGAGTVGTFTSGGTESIMLAVKAARDFARAERGIDRAEMVIPETAHAAFHKAAAYLGLDLVSVPIRPDSYRADVEAMAAAVTDRTALMVASAPGYPQGVVDPITELGQVAIDKGILFHVDGCMGGFLLPYFRRLGVDVPAFDFQVSGVTSISMDLHKYGFAPKGASVVLYRDASLRRHQIFCCASWPGYTVVNPTIQSAKSGGPAAAAWTVLRYLGDAGYLKLAEQLLASFRKLVAGLREIDAIQVLGEPHMTLVSVASEKVDLFHVIDDLRERGWYTQPQFSFGVTPATMHVQVAPANIGHVDEFLADLREVIAAAPPPQSAAGMAEALADSLTGEGLDPATFGNMMSMVGVQAGALPTRMADINRVLDALPPQARERLVVEFVNTLYG